MVSGKGRERGSLRHPSGKRADHHLVRTSPTRYDGTLRLLRHGRALIPGASSALPRVTGFDPAAPAFVRGRGPCVWDEDGNKFVDLNLGYGSLIHGHSPPEIVAALRSQLRKGLHFASPQRIEAEVAELLLDLVPTADRVVFCTTGTEATFNAVRLARHATHRRGVLVFEGHYHMNDAAATSPPVSGRGRRRDPRVGEVTPIPDSWGDVYVAEYNSVSSVERIQARAGTSIGTVILEPIMCNAGVIPPTGAFLRELRRMTEARGQVLVFDEVFTGFRVAPGGAQEMYGVRPDLSCFSKALGGGMPIAALAGRRELMDRLGSPGLPYGSTYAGHTLALAGTRASLEGIRREGRRFRDRLQGLTERACRGLEEVGRKAGLRVLAQQVPGAFQFYFTGRSALHNFREALEVDREMYRRAQSHLMDRGFFFHPDNFESLVLSTSHGPRDIDRFVTAAGETFAELSAS